MVTSSKNFTPHSKKIEKLEVDTNKQIRRFEREVETLQAENNNLVAQINALQYELGNSKRLRPLLKALARVLDAGVLSRMQRLNVPRKARTMPFKLSVTTDIQATLRTIRIYDMMRYFDAASGDRMAYKVARGSYMALSRGLFKLALHVSEMRRK